MKNYILSLKSILTPMEEKEAHIWLLHSTVAETTLSGQALRSVSRFKMNIPKWEGPDETQINTKQLGFRERSNQSEEMFQRWFKSKGLWNSNQDATWWRKCLSDQAKMLLFLRCLKETRHRHWALSTLRRTMQTRGETESGSFSLFEIASPEDKGAPVGQGLGWVSQWGGWSPPVQTWISEVEMGGLGVLVWYEFLWVAELSWNCRFSPNFLSPQMWLKRNLMSQGPGIAAKKMKYFL